MNLRTDATNKALTRTLSLPRLRTYLAETNGDLDRALLIYEHNTRISESFYTPLHCLEICLRNTVDRHMGANYGDDWIVSVEAPLAKYAAMAIGDALRKIRKPAPIPPSDIVAELKFSFWVGLLGPGYDGTLWRKALHQGFQTGPGKKRSDVHHRFNAIRRFRNRVAHHEPIFQKNPRAIHAEIIEAIGWMCRETQMWTQHQSNVAAVLDAHQISN